MSFYISFGMEQLQLDQVTGILSAWRKWSLHSMTQICAHFSEKRIQIIINFQHLCVLPPGLLDTMTGFPRNPKHPNPYTSCSTKIKKDLHLKKHLVLNRHRAPAQKPVLTQTAAKSYSRLALGAGKKSRLSASAALKSLLYAHTH